MSQVHPPLSHEQQRELAQGVEAAVRDWSFDEPETYKSAPFFVQAIHTLGLQVPPSCICRLHSVILNTPLPAVRQEVTVKVLAAKLIEFVELGCPISQAEASRWEDMLLTAYDADPRRAAGRQEGFGPLLSALLRLPGFAPSEELKEQLLDVAKQPASRDRRSAWAMQKAAEAWRVSLPREAARRLEQQAARKPQTTGDRPAYGGRPPAPGIGTRGKPR